MRKLTAVQHCCGGERVVSMQGCSCIRITMLLIVAYMYCCFCYQDFMAESGMAFICDEKMCPCLICIYAHTLEACLMYQCHFKCCTCVILMYVKYLKATVIVFTWYLWYGLWGRLSVIRCSARGTFFVHQQWYPCYQVV